MGNRVNVKNSAIWKRSMLQKLNMQDIRSDLDEIEEDGDMYGYETDDDAADGYYSEYKAQFDDLSGSAYALKELIEEAQSDGFAADDDIIDTWFVALLGKHYQIDGYDPDPDIRSALEGWDQDEEQRKAQQKLLRLKKEEMLDSFRQILVILTAFLDVKAAHDCLTSIVSELDDRAAIMKRKMDAIDGIYTDLTGKNAESFDRLVSDLPQRMWVE